MRTFNRRDFIKKVLKTTALLMALPKNPFSLSSSSVSAREFSDNKIVVVKGGDPESRLKEVLKALGGLEKMMPANAKVTIKPNASFSRTPAQGVNTNPEIVYHLFKACKDAGAKEMVAFDYTSDPADICFEMSGIREAVEKGGGRIYSAEYEKYYKEVAVPKAKNLKKQLINKDVLDCDFFINVPIPKMHDITILTMAMKNLMGVIWDRDSYHTYNLHECVAELSSVVKPDLNIVDATRVLLTEGPHGPGKTKTHNITVAGKDIVLVDAFCCTIFDKKPEDIPHVVHAHKLGIGEMDLSKAEIVKIDI